MPTKKSKFGSYNKKNISRGDGHTAKTHTLLRHFEKEWIDSSTNNLPHHIAREINRQAKHPALHRMHPHELEEHPYSEYGEIHGLDRAGERKLFADFVKRQSKFSQKKYDAHPILGKHPVLYRGVDPGEIKGIKKGHTVSFRPLISTTPDKGVAKEFGGGSSVEFHGITGKHTFTGYHSSHMHFGNEAEVVLKGAHKFKVAHVRNTKKMYYHPIMAQNYNYETEKMPKEYKKSVLISEHPTLKEAIRHRYSWENSKGISRMMKGTHPITNIKPHPTKKTTSKTVKTSPHLIVHPAGVNPKNIPSLQARLKELAPAAKKAAKVASKVVK